MSNQSNASRDSAAQAGMEAGSLVTRHGSDAYAAGSLGSSGVGSSSSGRDASVSQRFENAMAGGVIPGHPQRSIEPHISAANAAGIFAEGSRFGVYIVGPCIGHGGMARIYRAEHEGLRRQVALKVLTDGFAHDGEGRKRFLREARIAAAIKHPNVVNIFDVGVQDGIPYLVMELLEGEDLESLLQSRGALDEGTIIDLIVPVVAGLAAVHDASVVHRDLKPGNIFLSAGRNDETEPKLLDFGISKASGKGHMKLTSATKGLLMGTPFYMSPEAIQGADMTPLSDQYSLGVLLYECATGSNPFSADTFAETVRRITTGEYPPIAARAKKPSRRLVRIIERAMAVAPGDRFPDMRALGRELLLLAGQRTRITWSLSFGEVAVDPKSKSDTIVVANPRLPEVAPAPLPPVASPPVAAERARGTTALTVALGALAFAAAAVIFLRPTIGQPPPLPLAPGKTKSTTAALMPGSRAELDGPQSVPAEQGVLDDSLAQPSDPKATSRSSETARSRPPERDQDPEASGDEEVEVPRRVSKPSRSRSSKGSATRGRSSASRRAAARRATTAPKARASLNSPQPVALGAEESPLLEGEGTRPETVPEWAQGLSDEEEANGLTPRAGTNNAPIFD